MAGQRIIDGSPPNTSGGSSQPLTTTEHLPRRSRLHYGYWFTTPTTPHFSLIYGWTASLTGWSLNQYGMHKALGTHNTQITDLLAVRFTLTGNLQMYEVVPSVAGPWEVVGFRVPNNDMLFSASQNSHQPYFVFCHVRYGNSTDQPSLPYDD